MEERALSEESAHPDVVHGECRVEDSGRQEQGGSPEMTAQRKLRVFAYDISRDRNRERVAALLAEIAVRVQFSVFEGRVTDGELDRLMTRLEPCFEAGDSLRVYSIAEPQLAQCRRIGGPPFSERHDFWLL